MVYPISPLLFVITKNKPTAKKETPSSFNQFVSGRGKLVFIKSITKKRKDDYFVSDSTNGY